jgi:peptidoglycan/LPS O-acetylase OafA/YrhL
MDLAVASVSVFFVLSGFMMRYISSIKPGNLRGYAVDRFARVYSVVLPALALTILFDSLSAHFNPSLYFSNVFGDPTQTHAWMSHSHTFASQIWFRVLVRILSNLVMLSQAWFQDLSPLSNSPFWSLSYECVYYALFGITLYLRGSRRALGWALIFLLIGPNVLLLFPLWLLGCAAYDAYQNGFSNRNSFN